MNIPDNLKLPDFLQVPFDQFFNTGEIQQHEWEARMFLRLLLDELRPQRTVELGTWKGGMSVLLSLVSKKTVSIDITDYGTQRAKEHGYNLTLLLDDCCTDNCVTKTLSLLGGPIDLLFVDDSHIYEDVAREYDLWSPKVRSGGWIAFHDINPLANKGTDGHHSHLCQAHRFWSELQGDKMEIVANESHVEFRGVIPHGGIGVLKI